MHPKEITNSHNGVTGVSGVYFIHAPETRALKVGRAVDVAKRLASLQTANASRLVLLGVTPGGPEAEARMHKRFAAYHVRGEWYSATEECLLRVRAVLAEGGEPGTVLAELSRRNQCRYGLRGVRVALKDSRGKPYEVSSSRWGPEGQLLLKLCPPGTRERLSKPPDRQIGPLAFYSSAQLATSEVLDPEGTVRDAPAADCWLLSEWPVVCRCWCPETEE